MRDRRLSRRGLIVAALLAGVARAQAPAGAFPARAVRLIVPAPPGGVQDIRSRQLAQKLGEAWQQPVIVDNRPGATGHIALEMTARAAPDGYTLVMAGISALAISAHLMKLGFDPLADFAAVIKVTAAPLVLVAHPSLPFDTLSELVAYARAHPAKLSVAGFGRGGIGHLCAALFNQLAGIELQHLPYGGGTQQVSDVLGGQVPLLLDFPAPVTPHIRAGRLKGLAVSAERRAAVLPDVPTFAEQGYAGMEVTGWQGLLLPAGTPDAIVRTVHGAALRALEAPELREAIVASGAEVGGGSPEDFAALIRAEHARWGRVIAKAGIRLE